MVEISAAVMSWKFRRVLYAFAVQDSCQKACQVTGALFDEKTGCSCLKGSRCIGGIVMG